MNLSRFSRPDPHVTPLPDRRRTVLAGLLTAVAVLGAAPAMAAAGCRGAEIAVTGEGEAVVQPDMAIINLGVTTQGPTAAEAMTQNSTSQNAVIEALSAAGVQARDVQTSGLQLTPLMRYADNQPPEVTGYQAQNIVTVRVRDLASLGSTLDAIVGAGANEINGITFSRDEAAAVRDEARRDAVADARHRAEVLAEAAGLTLGPVLQMRDTVFGAPPGPQPMMQAMDAGAAKSVPIAGGEVAMTAQVEMRFALIGEAGACADMEHGDMHKMHHEDGAAGMPQGDAAAPDMAAPAAEATPESAPETAPGAEGETPPSN